MVEKSKKVTAKELKEEAVEEVGKGSKKVVEAAAAKEVEKQKVEAVKVEVEVEVAEEAMVRGEGSRGLYA